MKTFVIAVVVAASSLCAHLLAQDAPAPTPPTKPVYTPEAMVKRIRDGNAAGARTCALADGSRHEVAATVSVNGWTYRCLHILDRNLRPNGAAWTADSLPPSTSQFLNSK